jgi:probable rRNA maturation factor
LNRVRIDAPSARARALVPLVRRRARGYLRALKLDGCELSVSLVSDARIRALNKAWRGKDKATDVLSFPQGEGVGPLVFLGDIVISTDTARRQAREYSRTVEEEVQRYLAHGLLHLLGHDHHRPGDKRRMAAAEARLLGGAGMLG